MVARSNKILLPIRSKFLWVEEILLRLLQQQRVTRHSGAPNPKTDHSELKYLKICHCTFTKTIQQEFCLLCIKNLIKFYNFKALTLRQSIKRKDLSKLNFCTKIRLFEECVKLQKLHFSHKIGGRPHKKRCDNSCCKIVCLHVKIGKRMSSLQRSVVLEISHRPPKKEVQNYK